MALNPGDQEATEGMAREVFLALRQVLRPPLDEVEDTMSEEEFEDLIEEVEEGWRNLSFGVARGVVAHLQRDPDDPPDPADPPDETEYAEVFSSSEEDSTYWAWVTGFAGVFRGWAQLQPGQATVAELRTRLNTFFQNNPDPTSLRGIVR